MKNLVVTLKNGVSVQLLFEYRSEAEEARKKLLKCKKRFCQVVDTATIRVSEIALIEIMEVKIDQEAEA
ncbi:hypothetical protein [Enterococcus sp. 5H]|uniref:hypothetical protein n=1 Tax=Enterococcus sp. 5H TaxID=1229490 RepID=UPI002303C755|nr:hypothetical protein [Enterococcus sp. 5H]MDA9472636.1 hypothetical protein [Enterococcus sp. 5H]